MNMRKFLAMLLTLSLVLSLAAPMALAAEDGDSNDTNVTDTTGSGDNDDSAGGEDDNNSTTPSGEDDKTGGDTTGDDTTTGGDTTGDDTTTGGDTTGDDTTTGGDTTGDDTTTGGDTTGDDTTTGGDTTGDDTTTGGDTTGDDTTTGGDTNQGDTGINVPGTNPGDGETEEPRYDDEGYQIDENGNRVTDENGEFIKKPLDPGEIITKPEQPELTEEEKAALEELGGKADAVTGETSKEDLEAIKNSPLYDRLTDEQKKAVEDALAAIAAMEEPIVPPVVPVEGESVIYPRLMAAETWEEYEAILAEYTDEQLAADWALLTEEQINAFPLLWERLDAAVVYVEPDSGEYEGETVTFTNAGPLQYIPNEPEAAQPVPTSVRKAPRRMAAYGGRDADYSDSNNYSSAYTESAPKPEKDPEGVVSKKYLDEWDQTNGTGKIKIESYVTGDFSFTDTAADVVLVLDQSGSMKGSRQETMQNVVSSFIQSLADARKDKDEKHHVALISFQTSENSVSNNGAQWKNCGCYYTYIDYRRSFHRSSNCTVSENDHRLGDYYDSDWTWTGWGNGYWTYYYHAQVKGKSEEGLISWGQNKYKDESRIQFNLTELSGTMPEELKKRVEEMSAAGGTPTHSGMKLAKQVIDKAIAEDNGRPKVVILFTDGVPGMNNNDTTNRKAWSENAMDYADAMKGYTGENKVTIFTVGTFDGADPDGRDANNQFMKDIASTPEPGSKQGYYLAAKGTDTTALQTAFNNILRQIGNTSQNEYFKNAIVRDTLSPYIQVDTTAGKEIKAYSVPFNGGQNDVTTTTNKWGDRKTTVGDISYDSDTGVIDVKGFDFAKNSVLYVTDAYTDSDGNYVSAGPKGAKLVIEIPIKAKDGFLGGEGVPTNIPAQSGVFNNDGRLLPLETGKGSDKTGSPAVNVNIANFTVTALDKNIYYGGQVPSDLSELYEVDVPTDANDGWKSYFVETSEPASDVTFSNTEEKAEGYPVKVTLTPKEQNPCGIDWNADFSSPVSGKEKTVNPKLYIYTPTINFPDVRTYLSKVVFQNELNYPITEDQVTWKHDGAEIGTTVMEGSAPTLTANLRGRMTALHGDNPAVYDYYVWATSIIFNGTTTVTHRNETTGEKNDQMTKIAGKDVAVLSFTHNSPDCEEAGIAIHGGFEKDNGEFLVHVLKPKLTFKDITTYKGTKKDAPDVNYGSAKVGELVWFYPGAKTEPLTATAPDVTEPKITYEYQPDQAKTPYLHDKTYFVKDTPVRVQVVLDGMSTYTPTGLTKDENNKDVSSNYNQHVTFVWDQKDCPLDKCTAPEAPSKIDNTIPMGTMGHQFWVHVIPCELTVEKQIVDENGNAGKPYSAGDSFLFTITGEGGMAGSVNTQIFLKAGESKTIKDLPVGAYTVTEDGKWSWRYNDGQGATGRASLEPTETGHIDKVVIKNTVTNDKWLSSESATDTNNFIGLNPSKTVDPNGGVDTKEEAKKTQDGSQLNDGSGDNDDQ